MRPKVEARGGATRCPFCFQDCAPGARARVCRDCLVRHHSACWDENGECAGCGGKSALSSDRGGHTGLAVAGFVAGLGSSVLLSAAGITLARRLSQLGENGLGSLASTWEVALLLLLPICGAALALKASLGRDRRRRGLAIGGVALNASMLSLGVAMIVGAAARSPVRVPGPPTPVDRPTPAASPVAVARPDEDRRAPVALAGKKISIAWVGTSIPALEREPQTPAGWPAFRLAGEQDSTWTLPSGAAVVLGPESKEWTRSPIPNAGKHYFPTWRKATARVEMVGDRQRLVFLARDPRYVLIYAAGSEESPRTVEACASICAMVLAGNRLICTHGREQPFLTVIDVEKSALLKKVPVPKGGASGIYVNPLNPRLVYVHARSELAGFDAGTLRFLESYPRAGFNLEESAGPDSGIRLCVDADGRYLYAGVNVFDAAQKCKLVSFDRETPGVPQVDWNGRFVFTSNGVYGPGLVERVSESRYRFLGHLTDGNILAVENNVSPTAPTTLAVLDARTAQPLRKETYDTMATGWNAVVGLIPGTNRVLRYGLEYYGYKDVEPVGGQPTRLPRLQLTAWHPRSSFIGETWKLPLDLAAKDVKGLKIAIQGPRGMVHDPAQKAIVWRPVEAQKGKQKATITIAADGFEDLVLAEWFDVDYRSTEITTGKFGVFPSERFVWWIETTGKLVLVDPDTNERKTLAFDAPCSKVAEGNERIYVALRDDRIYELDETTLAVTRHCTHPLKGLLAIAVHPDQRSLTCVSTDTATSKALLVSQLPLDGDHGVTSPVEGPDGQPLRVSDLIQNPTALIDLCWLGEERFVLSIAVNRIAQEIAQIGGYKKSVQGLVYRWTDKEIEPPRKLANVPVCVPRGQKLVFALEKILDAEGRTVKTIVEGSVLIPGLDGRRYATASFTGASMSNYKGKQGVHLSFFSLNGATPLDSATYETESPPSVRFSHGFLLRRANVVVLVALTPFLDRDAVLYFLPYDPSGWRD